jgi:hypothetical protein
MDMIPSPPRTSQGNWQENDKNHGPFAQDPQADSKTEQKKTWQPFALNSDQEAIHAENPAECHQQIEHDKCHVEIPQQAAEKHKRQENFHVPMLRPEQSPYPQDNYD